MKRFIVGLISDTHGLVRPAIAAAFARVDLILHAGDVGGNDVLDALSAIAPVEAVDGKSTTRTIPRSRRSGSSPSARSQSSEPWTRTRKPTPELALARYSGDVVVFGHTHRAVTLRTHTGRLAVNPGAAGPRRFDLKPSVARVVIEDRTLQVDTIALG